PLVGVYCGNSVDGVRQFETWLGRPVDGILGYTGNASWADYDGSVGWAAGVWAAIDRRVFWSVPLIVNGASLAQAGSGAYDEHYRKAAQTLASWRPHEPKLYVRTGWEFNGNWFPWNAQGAKAADFKAAFRRFVSVFRSVSDRFLFEWNVNIGDVGMDPESAYPGDDVVDIVGMDFYWQTHLPTNPQQAWSQIVNQKWGLKWHQDFAKAHGKRTAYSEWGVRYDNAGYYVEQAKLWFEQHQVVYQTYWNADNDYPGKLSSGQYPATGAAYRTAFGP
ncbi:MAG TPA: glycosyl hydrolase, partial [Polyangiales bacterium]